MVLIHPQFTVRLARNEDMHLRLVGLVSHLAALLTFRADDASRKQMKR